jgi:RHS repeat-associated protein
MLFNHTTTSYDALSRPLVTTAPDGTTTTHQYGLDQDSSGTLYRPYDDVTDANSHHTRSRADIYGRRYQVLEYNGGSTATTTYLYSPLDLLTSVTDANGNATSMSYDTLGRKTGMSDPDMGSWSYSYNINGTLSSQTDAKGQIISFGYDNLDRLTSKTMPGGWASYYAYDDTTAPNKGIGHRTSMSTALNGAWQTYERWEFDARGRTTLAGQAIAGASQAQDLIYTYDSADRLITTMYYEAGETVTTTYDAAWNPYSMCGTSCYITSATYTTLSQPASRVDGSGITDSLVYNDLQGRLTHTTVGTGNRDYIYDAVGNIKTIVDNIWGQTQNFSYDARDRPTHAWTTGSAGYPGMAYDISTTYDAIGNLLSKTDVGSYSYGANGNGRGAGPHQARTVGNQSYNYDANGNLTSGGGRSYTWTADNLPATVTNAGVTESYTYDADGERVVRSAGGVTTLSFAGVWDQTTAGARTLYYTFNGQVVARRDANSVIYLHGDHLGSVTWAFNASGQQLYGQEYGPWGNVRAGSMTTSLNYTGQRLDGTGLLYYHARYYDPVLARFVSADSAIPNPANPQDFNRYAYVSNNPLKNIDPTGHAALCTIDACAGAYSGGTSVSTYDVGTAAQEALKVGGIVAVGAAGGYGAAQALNATAQDDEKEAAPSVETNNEEEAPHSADEDERAEARRRYSPTAKHAPGGWGTPMDLDNQTAEEVLNEGVVAPNGKQIYGYHDGKLYEYQPDNTGGYHGYPIPGNEAPPSVLKQLRDSGVISQKEYKKLVKGK